VGSYFHIYNITLLTLKASIHLHIICLSMNCSVIKKVIRTVVPHLVNFGTIYLFPHLLATFCKDWKRYKALSVAESVEIADLHPCLFDRTANTHFDLHYIYQGYWMIKRIVQNAPGEHLDIGSDHRLFIWLSALLPVTFIDIRPLRLDLPHFRTGYGNLLALPYENDSQQSVSSLSVIEHIGLGRYGDDLDPEGSHKACKELARIVQPGGYLYITLPVGKPRTCFNAHRIFDPVSLLDMCKPLELQEFSCVDDSLQYIEDSDPASYKSANYAAGFYIFRKQKNTHFSVPNN
jgi:hypothetical protein